ncbi:hypothetical protein HA466_0297500 [Hirschfeldia incana]|nr:hypothetical protein HA466_0297500 [Hirschfeldia incana]
MASSSSSLSVIIHGLAYENKNLLHKHVTEALARFPEIHPKVETNTNLLELVVPVDYCNHGKKCRDFVRICPLASYPKDIPPPVRVDCQYGSAITPGHTNIASSGFVVIPYMNKWDEDKSSLVSLISHLQAEFTREPPTFVIDVGVPLSQEQMGLVEIVLDYRLMHLYYGICNLTSEKTSAFFEEVAGRYPKDVADLADYIRTSKGGVKNYINIVAEILGLPPKTRFTVDVGNLHFLP